MQRINADIKSGQFKNVYLLYGSETYLRKQYRDKLKEALTGGDETMNYTYLEGNNAQVGELIDLAETLPFFAERRVIVAENTGWFKASDEALVSYLGSVCPTTILVFVEKEIDKRSKALKAADKAGLVVEFTTMDEATLARWIYGRAQKNDKRISERDIHYLIEKAGTDMTNLETELEKLICYCMDRDIITAQDIDAVCIRNPEDQVFDMIDAMAEKKQKKAIELYYDLLALKVEPIRILALLVRQFNILLQAKRLKANGTDNRTIAQRVGVSPYFIGKYISQASRFKYDYLRSALDDCLWADESIKTGRMNPTMSIEILLVKFSS